MPYKDPEKRKAYHKAYNQKYQPEWREKHPTYNANYLREWRKKHPDSDKRTKEQHSERAKEYYRQNPEKAKARRMLRYAVKVGKIQKPTRCQICVAEALLQADHHDYTKPYDVLWVCRPCHIEITVKRNRLGIIIGDYTMTTSKI